MCLLYTVFFFSSFVERKNWPSFGTPTYAYNALTVSSVPMNLPLPIKTPQIDSSDITPRKRSTASEPRPLLSAQYEALSDDD